jgi:lipoprotein-anchoring transpeptidase ErfK/SrfK
MANPVSEAKLAPPRQSDVVPVWSPDLPPQVAAKTPAESKPLSGKPTANVPTWAPGLPAHAAARPVATPTALAAILPPSAAHTDYPRLNGITNGEREYEEDGYASGDNPSNWIVRVFKHNHRLEVYYRDNLYKSYHAVFGRSEYPGPKEMENDRRTPEGDYMIVEKHRSRRFEWFLKLNYPNADDRDHFAELRDDGEIPRWAREGGQVGIHGTDNPLLNVGDVNWTTGCISIDNQDIDELDRLLPVGTVVIIKP